MTDRRTIAVDVRALVGSPSGIGFFTLAMLQHLADRGTFHYLGLAHSPVYGQSVLENAGVELVYDRAPSGVLWQQFLLPRAMRSRSADLLWSPLLTLPLRHDGPSVVTIHDLTPVLLPETHSLKVRMSILPFLARTVARAHRIVADSQSTAGDIAHAFPDSAGKLHVVYPGVDSIFRPGEPESIAETRAELGLQHGYVLFVGTLEPRKNVAQLLDAWESLLEAGGAGPGLVIVGEYGWRSRRLMKRIRDLESSAPLVYLGRVERTRLVRIYQAASVFVMPSIYEGFGLPAAEAMACGVPTVVSNSSSLPEVIGDAGVAVPLGDRRELARVIRGIVRDENRARELAEAGRARSRRFEWKRAAAQMEELFAELLR